MVDGVDDGLIERLEREWTAFQASDEYQVLVDRITDAVAPVMASIQRALAPLLKPGTYYGDALIVRSTAKTEVERNEAARRLARNHFSKGYIFHPARWSQLESVFAAWRGERSWEDGWVCLAAPRIIEAIHETRYVKTWGDGSWYDAIRRRVRGDIERDLLGRTTDAKWYDVELQDELPTPGDILEHSDIHLILTPCLNELPETHREALLGPIIGLDDTRIAEHFDVQPGTVRVWRCRALERLRDLLLHDLLPDDLL